MSNYVLVHGGDRDASIWNEVVVVLESKGHNVYCPSMTSVKRATLQENIDEVVRFIEAHSINDIILCGHSYGGMVIVGLFEKVPNKIQQLVFIDSVVPENGKSLYGLFSEYGFDYKDFDLTPDPGCLEKLYFDENAFLLKPKSYIRCLQSEFMAITMPIYEKIQKKERNWLYFCLDTIHGCMFTQPKELAVILAGLA